MFSAKLIVECIKLESYGKHNVVCYLVIKAFTNIMNKCWTITKPKFLLN